MTDTIEKAIQAAGANVAPRVTKDAIEANILYEGYFTADMGVAAEDACFGQLGDPGHPALKLLTICVLVLQNEFVVTGESACASPENFNAEVGRAIARANAIEKMWTLMGYVLKERLFQASLIQCEVGKVLGVKIIEGDKPAIPPHQQRVIDEQRDLDEKLAKLGDFIDGNPVFAGLSVSEQSDLKAQRVAMESYAAILSDRIARFRSAA